jgi:hypothetical protein
MISQPVLTGPTLAPLKRRESADRGCRMKKPAKRNANAKSAKPMLPRERAEFSAIVDRPALKLPNKARLVFWTIVNL